MGAINNAFNQALGAVAGAGLAIKHAKQTDESKMMTAEHSALVARNQASDAKLESDKTNAENFGVPDENGEIKSPQTRLTESDYAIEKATAAYEKARDEKSKKTGQKYNDLKAALNARAILDAKIEAVDRMRFRAEEQ